MKDKVTTKLVKALWSQLFDNLDSLHEVILDVKANQQMDMIGSSGDYPSIQSEK